MTRARRNPNVKLGGFGKGKTKQSFARQVNINNIMAKYRKTGAITHFAKHAPRYADVTGLDFQTAMDTHVAVQQMFDELPAELRNQFQHNPAAFLDWIQDPANAEQAEALGLREPTPFEYENEADISGEPLKENDDVPEPAKPEEPVTE